MNEFWNQLLIGFCIAVLVGSIAAAALILISIYRGGTEK